MIFTNKIALITGSSGGFGEAIALKLAKDGATLMLHYNKSKSEVELLKDKIELLGVKAYLINADFAMESSIVDMFNSQIHSLLNIIRPDNPKIDFLINNVGICEKSFLNKIDYFQFNKLMNINLYSVILLMKLSIPLMNPHGRIINVTSLMSLNPDDKYLLYGASKAALNNFTMALVQELGKNQITINLIAPGLIPTGILPGLNNSMVRNYITKHTALGRVGSVTDIANVVFLLCTNEAGWITGQLIEVSGGFKN